MNEFKLYAFLLIQVMKHKPLLYFFKLSFKEYQTNWMINYPMQDFAAHSKFCYLQKDDDFVTITSESIISSCVQFVWH